MATGRGGGNSRCLIEAGEDPRFRRWSGANLCQDPGDHGHERVPQLLLLIGVEVNAVDEAGRRHRAGVNEPAPKLNA